MGDLTLKNRVVMAPLTRCRAPNNVPSDLVATYYAQRADAGLLITEGTSPLPNGLGAAPPRARHQGAPAQSLIDFPGA